MKIIDRILTSDYFHNKPPVLIDIGASGEINPKWKKIAAHSVCIAFDADDRDFKISESDNQGYKKLVSVNRIVTSTQVNNPAFYLTSSPYCSSLLKPDQGKLEPWVFKSLFGVKEVITLPATTLSESLKKANVEYIDWFKTDTQGTDLRIFQSLPPELSGGILCAEFEPGIIDAYEGEDKLFMVMKEMYERNFWLSSMKVKGTQRINSFHASQIGLSTIKRVIRNSPCWAEVTYLSQSILKTQRQLLLLIIFAILEKQYGFAIEIIDYAKTKYSDSIFEECKSAVFKRISIEKAKIPIVILKRQLNKILANIND